MILMDDGWSDRQNEYIQIRFDLIWRFAGGSRNITQNRKT
jgi:hypothetical protein